MDMSPPIPRSILVVEDEQIVALDIEEDLEAMGYRVVGTAATGVEAVELAAPDRVGRGDRPSHVRRRPLAARHGAAGDPLMPRISARFNAPS